MSTPPELGPLLGHLTASPVGTGPDLARLEPIRIQLLTELFERAAVARRTGSPLNPEAWLEVWGAATQSATGVVMVEAERRLREAAGYSRYPKRHIAALLPTAEDRRILAARFSAAGTDLEAAVESSGEDLRRTTGELERAWERLVNTARQELDGWGSRAGEIRAWRRPWRSLVIGGAAAGLILVWVGLVLGGYLPVPPVLRPVVEWYWSLPWP